MKKLFILKEEHIKLLRQMNVWWDDCEFGAPSINCKRPYGNSDVYGDIAKILGIKGTIVDNEIEFSEEEIDIMENLHKETETALQIVLITGEFLPGEYVADISGSNWKRKEKENF
jgi:hypothetical protein